MRDLSRSVNSDSGVAQASRQENAQKLPLNRWFPGPSKPGRLVAGRARRRPGLLMRWGKIHSYEAAYSSQRKFWGLYKAADSDS